MCRRIKSDMSLSIIPVLVLTGSRKDKDHIAALDADADAFLPKDSTAEELLAVVSRLLETSATVQPLLAGDREAKSATYRTRILAIDDSPTFLNVLCNKLAEAGFEVTGAASGEEAIAVMDRQLFDVAVTDVVMPEMDGFEFCNQARKWAIARNRQLGLLVLTGSDRDDVLVRSLDSGADDYVSKSQDMT